MGIFTFNIMDLGKVQLNIIYTSFEIFWEYVRHNLAAPGCFCQEHESDECHWILRCRARLIFSKSYLLDLPQWLG